MHTKNSYWHSLSKLVCFICFCLPVSLLAAPNIVSLDTNGAVFQIDPQTAALTEKTAEAFHAFSLGGTARNKNKFFYVAEPSGSVEKTLHITNIKTGVLTKVDLDRNEAVSALFFKDRKLFGFFYDGTLGTLGLYRIAQKTGLTKLVLDLSDLDVAPIPGAISKFGEFFYLLVHPESDSSQRQLLRFKTKSGSAKLFDVRDTSDNPVSCEQLAVNSKRNNFICLASAADETQVNVCRLSLRGKATCLNTLPEILRVGGGHTLMTPNQKIYYAFVYAPGEVDNQRLIKFNARGVLKANISIPGIMIGGEFSEQGED